MADRYDPKLSVRSVDRRPADTRRDADGAEEDPLVEFTRVFTGRAALDAKPPPVRPVNDGTETEVEVNRDLESELLSDLQASFAAIQAPLAAAASQPAPEPPPPPMPRATPTIARSDRPRPGSVTQAAAQSTPQVPQFPTFDPPPPSFRADPPAAKAEAPAARPEAPPPRSEFRPARPEPAPVRPEPPTVAVRPPSIEPEELPPPPERPSLFRRRKSEPAEAVKPDAGKVPLRPTIAANAAPATTFPKPAEAAPTSRIQWPDEPAPALVPTAATRWDWPENDPDSAARTASRFAPPRAAVAPAKPAIPEPPPPPAPAMLAPDIEDEDELPPEPEFDLADLATVPGYGEDDDPLAALPEGGYDDLRPRRFGRGTVLVVLAFLIVIGGGLGIIFFRSPSTTTSGGRPPVIAADTTPTKVAPPVNPAADTDRPNKLIYDRVDDTTDTTGTHLVTPNNNPVADVPNASGGNPISRVIIPGGPGYDQPTNGQAAPAADSTAEDDDTALGPRKVRTVIVRPDGTIVANNATDGSGAASADVVPTAGPANAAAPVNPPALPPATRTPAVTTPSTVGTGATDSAGNYVDLPKVDRVGAAPGDLPAGPAATKPAATPAAPPKVSAVKPPTPIPAPAPAPPAPVPHPTVVANTNPAPAAPMNLTRAPTTPVPAAPAASAPAAAPVAGGSYVQLASLPSEAEAQATFRALQARYGGLLSSYSPNIQRADLGAKGVYFRLRVGPVASSDAQQLCSSLKSAGGDCLIAPR